MKILVCGGLGYVGTALLDILREENHETSVIDPNWFKTSINQYKNMTIFEKDVRSHSFKDMGDCCVYLSAVSNDPMGKKFSGPTYAINRDAAVKAAKIVKSLGFKKFIFASSCSVYGGSGGRARKEEDPLDPLTDYAISKVETESLLKELASRDFKIVCLRFATACGASRNTRLDLVLNDFVVTALNEGEINVLSDGSPWRPFIHVNDMARAILFSCENSALNCYEIFNVGRKDFNYQMKELAQAVSRKIGCNYRISGKSSSDSRSYSVDFSKFNSFSNYSVLKEDLLSTVEDLSLFYKNTVKHFGAEIFNDFRNNPRFIRLKALQEAIDNNYLNNALLKN